MTTAFILYKEMFDALKAIVNDNNFNNSVIRNSEEVRKVYADVLRKCLELERQVRDIVQVILRRCLKKRNCTKSSKIV